LKGTEHFFNFLAASLGRAGASMGWKLGGDAFSSCGDPAFADFPICAGGPININNQNYGGGFLDVSTGRLFFAQDSVSIVELELATGNSIITSL